MHAGNIFASLISWLIAKSSGGEVVLRIDNLDRVRSKQEFIDYVQRDYELLGLTWDAGPYFQSDNAHVYEQALDKLVQNNLVYPCFCTRAEIRTAEANVISAPHSHPNATHLPNTNICSCINLTPQEIADRFCKLNSVNRNPVYRLSISRLFDFLQQKNRSFETINEDSSGPANDSSHATSAISFTDKIAGSQSFNLLREYKDFIVKRSDGAFAYQLAVVVDDALEGVNCVVRACDLLPSTPLQIALQRALGLNQPNYAHVPLLCAPDGRRLAKRNKDAYIDVLFDEYKTPKSIIGRIAYVTGLAPSQNPTTPSELLKSFNVCELQNKWKGVKKITWS